MRLFVLTAVHKRIQVAEQMLLHTREVMEKVPGVEAHIVVVATPGDLSLLPDWVVGIECRNRPVSFKWQAGLDFAMKGKPDAVMTLGSDDFITAGAAKLCVDAAIGCEGMAGPEDFWFFNAVNGRYGYLRGPTELPTVGFIPCGGGRVYSRAALGRTGGLLWPMMKNHGLDTMASCVLYSRGVKQVCVNIRDAGERIVDVKSGFNINRWSVHIIDDRMCAEVAVLDLEEHGLGRALRCKPTNAVTGETE